MLFVPGWRGGQLHRGQSQLKSGNVHVRQSKRFRRFEDYFTPKQDWESSRDVFFRRANLPSNPGEVADYLENRLNTAYDLFLKSEEDNSFAVATEHYTDTHGYTDINFAAFAMLGRRFCPRIRGLRNQRIYRIGKRRDYGSLSSIVGRTDRKINPRPIVAQWDRMGHLYASLERGHTTASVALKRLVGYDEKNH